MVELGETFLLVALGHTTGRCLGVNRGRKDGEVICSFADGTVSLYDAHAIHCTKSWQLSCSEKLTSAAVACDGKFYGVKNKKEVIVWDETANWGSEFITVEFSEDVLDVLTTPSLTHPLVVLCNGNVAFVRKDGTVTYPQHLKRSAKSHKRIVHLVCTTQQAMSFLITIKAASSSPARSYWLECCLVTEDNVNIIATATMPAEELGILRSCFIADTLLYTQWSSHAICRTNILPLLTSPDASSSSHTDTHQLQLHPVASLAHGSNAMARISDDYFALVSCEDDCLSLRVHDCKYGTEHACLTTKETPPTNLLYFCEGFLFFPSCAGLSGCSVTYGKSSLATCLGRSVEKANCTVSKEILPTFHQWPGYESDRSRKVEEVYADMVKKNKTAAEVESVCSRLLQDPSSLVDPVLLPLLPVMVQILLDGCGEHDHSQTLIRLVESRTLPTRLSDQLVEHALSHHNWPLVVSTVVNIGCVPEERIVELLASALKLPSEFTVTSGIGRQVSREQLLCLILSLPHNKSLLHHPLSLLPTDRVMDLLEFLCSRITFDHLLRPWDSSLSYASTLEWVGLLLDSHFTSLSLVPEAGSRFAAVSSVVNKQVKFLSLLTFVEELCSAGKRNLESRGGTRNSRNRERKPKAGSKRGLLSHKDWQYRVDSLSITF